MSNRYSGTQLINLLAGNTPIVLSTQYKTRAIAFKLKTAIGDTAGSGVVTWTDPFAGPWLAIKNIIVQVGDRQVVNCSGQMMAYYYYLTTGRMPYTDDSAAGAAATTTLNTFNCLGLDFTNFFGNHPIDSMIDTGPIQVTITPFGAAGDVFTNAGATIGAASLEVTSHFDELAGRVSAQSKHAKKMLSMFSKTLTANTANQPIPFNLPLGNRVARIMLLCGSNGATKIIPVDPGFTFAAINMNEFIPFPNLHATFIRENNIRDNPPPSVYGETLPAAAATGQVMGIPGFYVIHLTSPNDANQLYQMPVVTSANNNAILDNTSSDRMVAAGTVSYDMLVESYYDVPELPAKKE